MRGRWSIMPWVFEGAVAAASMGMGCGTCCGSGISAILFGYLTTHAKNFAQSLRAFLCFYLGKLFAVSLACLASSLLGRCLISESGLLAGIPVHRAVDVLMIVFGAFLICGWFRERRSGRCSGCHHCGDSRGKRSVAERNNMESGPDETGKESLVHYGVLFGMGAGYGISPCVPLLVMMGYAVTMSPLQAVFSGIVFGLSTALVPMLLLLVLCGVLSLRLQREAPEWLNMFRLLTYIALIGIFAVEFLTS